MKSHVKTSLQHRRCIVGTTSGECVGLFGPAVEAVVDNLPRQSCMDMWTIWSSSHPVAWDTDTKKFTDVQQQELIALLLDRCQHELQDEQQVLRDNQLELEWWQQAKVQLNQGFIPPNGSYLWFNEPSLDFSNWCYSPQSDGIPALLNYTNLKIVGCMKYVQELNKHLKKRQIRANDRYYWADIHTETVKNITVTPV